MHFARVVASLFVSWLLISKCVFGDTFGIGASSFEIDFVTVGDAGNVADVLEDGTEIGSVSYDFRIAKYEISQSMVDSANSMGELGIGLYDLTYYGGNGPDRPATGVDWNEAARFVNWLNTSQGFAPAYKFSTQPGRDDYAPSNDIELWLPNDSGYDSGNPFRNRGARYFLPSSDEWHKAAYFDAERAKYFEFPTSSDQEPLSVASGSEADTAVYSQPGPADVTATGAYGPYGTMGQGGNVWEWEETQSGYNNSDPSERRRLRGGSWVSFVKALDSSINIVGLPSAPIEDAPSYNYGFRVAGRSAPELSGDFTGNGDLDAADISMFNGRDNDIYFDVNNDGVITQADQVYWVHELAQSYFGDVNLDGEFNSADLISVFQAGEYEDEIEGNSTWATGDWNADGEFTTGDLTMAFQDGGYEQGPRQSVSAVPEPSTALLCTIAAGITVSSTRRKRF